MEIYLVGGAVRDKLLGLPVEERDWLVVGATPQQMLDLGYKPTHDMEAELSIMLDDLIKYKERILARSHALIPDIRWDGSRRKVSFIK